MGIDNNNPKISALKHAVEKKLNHGLIVHNDFVRLADDILNSIKVNLSVSTLQRVWKYSTRGYETISIHTLNVLSQYAGYEDWERFCKSLQEMGIIDSDLFDVEGISSSELNINDRLEIGWLPDRRCIVRYLGKDTFIAEECENSTMQTGDTFKCLEFLKGQPAIMDNYQKNEEEDTRSKRYVAGVHNGLTILRKLN